MQSLGKTVLTCPETDRISWQITHAEDHGGVSHNILAYYDCCPWNPVTREIVYSSAEAWKETGKTPSNIEANGRIFILDEDCTHRRCVGENCLWIPHTGSFPMWTADGEGVVARAHEGMILIDIKNGGKALFPGIYARAVHPDGVRLACESSEGDLKVFSIRDRSVNTIVSTDDIHRAAGREPRNFQVPGGLCNFNWSPDGSKILMRIRGTYDGAAFKDLWVAHADGSGLTCLLSDPGWHHHSWHPDGKRVLFAAQPPNREGNRVYLIDGDGRNKRMISESKFGGHPIFSPDGSKIVTNGPGGLYLMDSGTGKVEKLLAGPEVEEGMRTDPHATWSRDGRYILYNSGQSGTWQVYVIPMDDP